MPKQCRDDGRCQYAIDSGAEDLGHCPKGKCVMPEPTDSEMLDWLEAQSNGMKWLARQSTTGRGYRVHNDPDGEHATARDAIRAAMKGAAS